MRLVILSVIALIVSGFLYSADFYQEFLDAYKNKDNAKALSSIKNAYRENPKDDNIAFWYGYMLHSDKDYKTSLGVFEKISDAYSPITVRWYIASCLTNLKQSGKAIPVLEESLKYPDTDKESKRDNYTMLLKLYSDKGDAKKMEALEKDALIYFEKQSAQYRDFARYLYYTFYENVAVSALSNKNDQTAQTYYQKALRIYNLGNTHYKIYMNPHKYGMVLHGLKKFGLAEKAFENLPKEAKKDGFFWYYADTLKNLGKNTQAIQLLKSGIPTVHATNYFTPYLYTILVDLCYAEKDLQSLLPFEKGILSVLKKKDDATHWVYYQIATLYQDECMKVMLTDPTSAQAYYQKVSDYIKLGLGKYAQYLSLEDLEIVLDASRYWEKNPHYHDSAYTHHALVLIVENLNANWTDRDKKTHSTTNRFDYSKTNSYSTALSLMNKVYFYYTGGKVRLDFTVTNSASVIRDITYTPWKSVQKNENGKPLQEVDIYSPVVETISPPLGELFFNLRNRYDTIILVYPSQNITKVCTGSLSRLSFVPYVMVSEHPRGFIVMASETMNDSAYNWKILIHEFFHVVEALYRDRYSFVQHAYQKEFKDYWAKWYRGNGEFSYYYGAFQNVVNPLGLGALAVKARVDSNSPARFTQKRELAKKYTSKQLIAANQWIEKGWEFHAQKNAKKALSAFEAAYKNFPDSDTANETLGWMYLSKKSYKKALAHYLHFAKVGAENRDSVYNTAYLYEMTGNKAKAAETYLRAYVEFGKNPQELYEAGRVYYQISNYQDAYTYWKIFIESYPEHKLLSSTLNMTAFMLCFQTKDYDSAIQLISRYYDKVEEKKIKASLSFYLGYAYGENGQKKNAIKWMKEALKQGYENKDSIQYYIKQYSD